MNELTAVFKAFSDRNRLRVVVALMSHDELCACQLTELLQVSGATASRHMGILIASGLVASRKEGRWVYYRLCREQGKFSDVFDWIERKLSNDPDAEVDAKALKMITSFDPEELCRKQRGQECCPQIN